jgi:hypothetical protein
MRARDLALLSALVLAIAAALAAAGVFGSASTALRIAILMLIVGAILVTRIGPRKR